MGLDSQADNVPPLERPAPIGNSLKGRPHLAGLQLLLQFCLPAAKHPESTKRFMMCHLAVLGQANSRTEGHPPSQHGQGLGFFLLLAVVCAFGI